jgi:dTDP-4-dehydrorhamnose 3,5-epimerase
VKVRETQLDGVFVIEPPTIFDDFRGQYVEIYNADAYKAAGIAWNFVQDDISVSYRHVLRGIHGDYKTAKLISCIKGSFYLVVVDNREESSGYRRWQCFTLSDQNRLQVLVPPGFGNGHLVMTETAIFHYKQTTNYDRSGQFTLLWNDPDLNIWWPVTNPIVSRRDAGLE